MNPKQLAEWGRERNRGQLRFVLKRASGLGSSAAGTYVAMVVLSGFTENFGTLRGLSLVDGLAAVFVVFAVVGAAGAALTWRSRERQYVKARRTARSAKRARDI